MGLTPPRSGSIVFNGSMIVGKQPFEIARLGIGFIPEDRIIFPGLTVWENLEMGIKGKDKGYWNFERVYELFPSLKERENQLGGTLSGGEQQMLTIARTLMGNPQEKLARPGPPVTGIGKRVFSFPIPILPGGGEGGHTF